MIGRVRAPEVRVASGERVLAWAVAVDGTVLAGTAAAFYAASPGTVVEPVRIPWERVEAAQWDRDESVLDVAEVGTWGEQRPRHRFEVEDPRRLLQLVRERVTASIVVQRHVPVAGRRGFRVIARRPPTAGDHPLEWFYEYDEGIDPEDPVVRVSAAEALAAARADVGL